MASRRPAKNTTFQVDEGATRTRSLSAAGVVEEDMARMFIGLLQGFFWFGEGLHSFLRACGWAELTRPQTLVVTSILLGDRKPTEIASRLGVSRQAVHETLSRLNAVGFVLLAEDADRRSGLQVQMTADGQRLLGDAERGLRRLCGELEVRIGRRALRDAVGVLASDWGPPLGAAVVRPGANDRIPLTGEPACQAPQIPDHAPDRE